MKSYSYNENIVALYRGRSNQESQFLKIKADTMLPEFGAFFTHSFFLGGGGDTPVCFSSKANL